jgi:hypothetical protein
MRMPRGGSRRSADRVGLVHLTDSVNQRDGVERMYCHRTTDICSTRSRSCIYAVCMAHNPEADLDRVLALVVGYVRALRTGSDAERTSLANAALEAAVMGVDTPDIAMSLSLVAALAASLTMDVNPEDPYQPIHSWQWQVRQESRASASPKPDVQ